jgi:hypothetical protein
VEVVEIPGAPKAEVLTSVETASVEQHSVLEPKAAEIEKPAIEEPLHE